MHFWLKWKESQDRGERIKNLQERTQSEKPNEEGRRKTSILRCLWFTVMLTALLKGTVEHPGSEERGSFAVEVLENRFHFVWRSASCRRFFSIDTHLKAMSKEDSFTQPVLPTPNAPRSFFVLRILNSYSFSFFKLFFKLSKWTTQCAKIKIDR